MFRLSTCKVLAAAVAAAGWFIEVGAQLDQMVPPGTPGAEETQSAIDQATAGTPSCSCDCCKVTARSATQQIAGQQFSCTLDVSTPNSGEDQCPETCANTDLTSTVVTSDDGPIQYARYCLLTCLPQSQDLGSTCRKVTTEEQAKLLTSGGNGRDPASILAPISAPAPEELKDPDAPPEPPQLADAAAVKEANDKAAADAAGAAEKAAGVKAEAEKIKETGAMVAHAAGKSAIAAGLEARLTEAEASSGQWLAMSNGDMEAAKSSTLMVTAAKAQVQAAEVRAKVYAASAAKAAARAEAEMKEIKDMPRKAAQLAADEAKRIVQGEINEAASNLLWVKSRLAGPALPVPLAEAAVRAAAPYYNVMNKAIAMGNLYEANAHNLQDQAQSLQEQSRTVASQAVGYQQAGYGDMAKKLMAQAKGMLNEAQSKDAAARKDYEVAEGVRKSVPNYQANAALASARATTLANPAGQPPPARPPGFLQLISQKKLQKAQSH